MNHAVAFRQPEPHGHPRAAMQRAAIAETTNNHRSTCIAPDRIVTTLIGGR